MRSFTPAVVALCCGLLLVGCQRSSGIPTKPKESDRASDSIVGRWTTSTSPEMASSRTNMAFLESGEYQFRTPLILFGKPVTAKVEGKEVAAELKGSGLWELNGERIRVRVTQTNQPSITFPDPWEYKIISRSAKKLVLEEEGGKIIALFREE
jgi:hypothetical protein